MGRKRKATSSRASNFYKQEKVEEVLEQEPFESNVDVETHTEDLEEEENLELEPEAVEKEVPDSLGKRRAFLDGAERTSHLWSVFGPKGGIRRLKKLTLTGSNREDEICIEDVLLESSPNEEDFDIQPLSDLPDMESRQIQENLIVDYENLLNRLFSSDDQDLLFRTGYKMNVSKPLGQLKHSSIKEILKCSRRVIFKVLQLLYPRDPLALLQKLTMTQFLKDKALNIELSSESEVIECNVSGSHKEADQLKRKLEDKYRKIDAQRKQLQRKVEISESVIPTTVIEEKVKDLILSSGCGSSVIVETESLLQFLLQSSCSKCKSSIDLQRLEKVGLDCRNGFDINVCIPCKCLEDRQFRSSPKQLMNNQFPFCSLISGEGYHGLTRILTVLGVVKFPSESSFYKKICEKQLQSNIIQKAQEIEKQNVIAVVERAIERGETTIPVAGDCSWSHRRNASEATFTLISSERLNQRYAILKCATLVKTRGSSRKGNFDGSSPEMEHAGIEMVLNDEWMLNYLKEKNVTFSITIDGDFKSLESFEECPFIKKLYLDYSHWKKCIKTRMERTEKSRNNKSIPGWKWTEEWSSSVLKWLDSTIYHCKEEESVGRPIEKAAIMGQLIEVFIDHASDKHSRCWPCNCKHARNGEMDHWDDSRGVWFGNNLSKRDKFLQVLQYLYQIPQKQNVGGIGDTSIVEALHSSRLMHTSKHSDFYKTYEIRMHLTTIRWSIGFLGLIEFFRSLTGNSIGHDSNRIQKIEGVREKSHTEVLKNLAKSMELKALRNERFLNEIRSIDYTSFYIAYKKEVSENVYYVPSWAEDEQERSGSLMCMSCKVFPR